MMGKLRNIQKGFTIIEVLVVLAIAGLIMVIVFIAVPNLQRSQRNEARNNDARLIANSINECLSNRNGVIGSCQATGANAVTLPTNLNQLTGTNAYASTTGGGSTTVALWTFGLTCDADGTGTATGNARQFVVRYQNETASTSGVQRCIKG